MSSTVIMPWVPTLQVILACLGFALTPVFAKAFLVSSVNFFVFCFAYTLLRALFQLPVVWKSSRQAVPRSAWKYLLLFGLVGGGVRLTELAGISLGVPISEVGFLIYSHPIWAIALGFLLHHESPGFPKMFQAMLCLLGVGVLALNSVGSPIPVLGYVFPLLCSLFIALWICLSKHLGVRGVPIAISGFTYDAVASLVILVTALSQMDAMVFFEQLGLLLTGPLLGSLIACSLITGVLPNFLFYRGVRNLSIVASALFLTLEPVLTAFAAWLFWSERPSVILYWAGLLILLGNIPLEMLKSGRFSINRRRPRAAPVPAQPAVSLVTANGYTADRDVTQLIPDRKPVLAARGPAPSH